MNLIRIISGFAITALCVISVAAQCSPDDVKALEKFDRDWSVLTQKGDRAGLEAILADDYRSIGFPSLGATKKQTIDNAVNNAANPDPNPNPATTSYDNYVITCTANSATITHRNVGRRMVDGTERVNYGRSVHILEKRNGRWQVVSSLGHPMLDDWAIAINTELDGLEAYRKRDVKWFDDHLSDNYRSIGPDGKNVGRAQVLEMIRNDTTNYDVMELTNINVRGEGETMVLTGVYHMKWQTADGKTMDKRMSFTRTLMKTDGLWKVLSSHSSEIAGN